MSHFAKFIVVLACLATFIGIFNAIPQVAHASSRTYSSPVISSLTTSPSAVPADAYDIVRTFYSQNFGYLALRKGYQGSNLGTGFGVRHIEYEHPPLDYNALGYVYEYGHVARVQPDGSVVLEGYDGAQNYRLVFSYQNTKDGLGLGVVTFFKI